MHLLDPTAEIAGSSRPPAPRLAALPGAVIGLLDISKPRGDVFLEEVARQLTERGAVVKRYMKPTFAKPAPADLRAKIAEECGAVIEALAD